MSKCTARGQVTNTFILSLLATRSQMSTLIAALRLPCVLSADAVPIYLGSRV